MNNIIIIRIKGTLNVRYDVKDTLESLNLKRKYNATLVRDTPVIKGMLKKAKDFIIWSEVDEAQMVRLFKERGRTSGWRKLTQAYLDKLSISNFETLVKEFSEGKFNLVDHGIKPYFSLPPPKKGFPRRKYKADELLSRMLG